MNPVPIYVLVDDKTDSANHLGRLNVASISRDEIRFCLAHEGKIKIGSSEAYSSDLISIGSHIDAIFGRPPRLITCSGSADFDRNIDNPEMSICARNLNQVKAALLIEERGLSSFNNLTKDEVGILQRMSISRPDNRSEFMSIFVGKLFGLTDNFPLRFGLKLHLVIAGCVSDTIVLAPRTATADRLTTIHDVLCDCGLGQVHPSGTVVCQGVVLHISTPLYFLRETAQQIDGFIHLVYKYDENF